jgi:branched-chain amino acid transport system permease protein
VVLAVVTIRVFEQLTANGIFRGAAYGLLGVGFALILGVTGRFHFAYSLTYTFAAYMAFTFHDRVNVEFWLAAVLGVLVATALGVGIERVVYRPLVARAGATALLAVFVASLGIGIAGVNLIDLAWSSRSMNYVGPKRKGISLLSGHIHFLNFDIYQTVTAIVLVVVLAGLLRFTSLGRQIKATRVNPDLATIIGINANTVYLICFAFGTFFAGAAAFWYGLQFTVNPDMGQRPVIYAFVVAFLAGTASGPIRVFLTGVLVALLEQWASMFISARWTQTAVFVVLAIYLTWKSFASSTWYARLRLARA